MLTWSFHKQQLSRLTSFSGTFVALPPHFISFLACFLLLLLSSPCTCFPLPSCSLTDLHRKGVALPDPAEILGNLDKPGEDPDDAPCCLRETDAHADFLFHFAKTVIVCSTFKESCNVIFLSGYMSISLEAYAVLTYANSYDTWMEEATRRKEGRNEEDSISPNTPDNDQ